MIGASFLLERLAVEAYRRFFRTAALFYPMTMLYFSHWVPGDRLYGYLFLRAPVAFFLIWLGWADGHSLARWRTCALLFLGAALLGNVQLVAWGGPNLILVLAHAGCLVLGFVEIEVPWAMVMLGILSICWTWTSRLAGGSADFASGGLALSMGICLFVVQTRGAALRSLAHLLGEQQKVNKKMVEAVALLDDCNSLLQFRVQERRVELGQAKDRVTQAYADVRLSHQEKSQLQAEWLQAQRLEMLGRFASGLSHHFSNTVTCIWASTAQLRECLHSEAVRTGLVEIEIACEKAAPICRRLLMACGTQWVTDRPFEVNLQIQECLAVLRRTVANPLSFLPSPGPCYAFGDPSLLDQVILNLVLNAAAASSRNQVIAIQVEQTVAGGIQLSVKDQGKGIESGLMQRIFEPFFTSGAAGQGHGLGLAIVQGAVERLHGCCSVESEAGEGSTFRVQIPEVQPDSGSAILPAPTLPSTHTESRSLRISLVEDQDALRKLLATYLRKHSHEVTDVACAEDLIAAAGSFDLLITDVNLPGRDGVDLAKELMAGSASLRVMFMSGYPFEAESVGIDSSRWFFLPKPFRLSEFGASLSQLMNS